MSRACGRPATYATGCRCDACTEVWRAYQRGRRLLRAYRLVRVAPEVYDAVRAHAEGVLRHREVVGVMFLRDGGAGVLAAVRSARKRNYASRGGAFRVSDPRGGGLLGEVKCLYHSHPLGGAEPSDGDLSGAHDEWLGRPYAIYSRETGALRFYVLRATRDGWDEIPSFTGTSEG